MIYLTAVVAWVVFAAIIALFQALGFAVLKPLVGPTISHSLTTVSICLCLIVMITGFVRWAGRMPLGHLFALGLVWALLTLAFELGVGHFGLGEDWPSLMSGYNVFEGRLWPMVPLTMLLWPVAAGRLQMR